MIVQHYEIKGCPVTVIHLWQEQEECNMCGALGYHHKCVPWYCGPVAEGDSEGGYKSVCNSCYTRWERWNDSLHYYGA